MPGLYRHIGLRCILVSAMGLFFSLSSVMGQCDSDTLSALEQSQYDALMEIYGSTIDSNGNRHQDWGKDCNYCEWTGVDCDVFKMVTDLVLFNSDDNPVNLSSALFELSSLKTLYVSGGHVLSSEIPDNIGDLNSLEVLELNHMGISGNIPPSIGQLVNLSRLSLRDNNLRGEIPVSLGNLSSLEYLSLRENLLEGTIPGELGSLQNLNSVSLRNNLLTGCYPQELLSWCGKGFDLAENCIYPDFDSFCEGETCFTLSDVYSDNLTICQGERVIMNAGVSSTWDYNWSDGDTRRTRREYPEETTSYFVDVITRNGCTYNVTFDVTVLESHEVEIEEEICHGGFYIIGDRAYSRSGSYRKTLETSDGCDSIIYLDLTVLPPLEKSFSSVICTGQTYEYAGQSFSETGDYSFEVPGELCDTVIYLSLEVFPLKEEFIQETICDGQEYFVNNQSFNQSGSYTIVLSTSHDCDSIVYLDLTVLPEKTAFIQAEICEGDVFYIEDYVFDSEGNHSVMLESSSGCDSTVDLSLTVLPHSEYYFSEEICPGESVFVDGQRFNHTGYFEVVSSADNGCDSLIAFDLLLKDPAKVFLDTVFCFGQPITFNGERILLDGTFTYTTTGANGCDSITTLTASVVDKEFLFLEEYFCSYGEYEIGGFVFDDPGEYDFLMDNGAPCLSQVYLILHEDTAGINYFKYDLCAGQEIIHNNQVYNRPGSYSNSFITEHGCERIDIIRIKSIEQDTTRKEISICKGETFLYETTEISSPGVYAFSFQNQKGCDSIVNLSVSLYPEKSKQLHVAVCPGNSYEYRGQNYDPGIHTISIPAETCDSIVYLNITQKEQKKSFLSVSICAGETYPFGDNLTSTAGTYYHTIKMENGCDSIVELNLEVKEIEEVLLNWSICSGETISFFDQEVGAPGMYVYFDSKEGKCDVKHTLSLETMEPDTVFQEETFCKGDVYKWNNQTIGQSGQYFAQYLNQDGCDSTVILDVLFQESQVITETITVCLGDTLLWHGQEITDPGVYNQHYQTAFGCDSVHFTEVYFQPLHEKSLTVDLCPGTFFTFAEHVYFEEGSYFTMVEGEECDTLYTINIQSRSQDTTYIQETICETQNFMWNNTFLEEEGTHAASFLNRYGCDSFVLLSLVVEKVDTNTVDASICSGESYAVADKNFTTPGQYIVPEDNGPSICSAVTILNLSVLKVDTTFRREELCAGEQIEINNNIYDAPGIYIQFLSASSGCDSILSVHIQERPIHEEYVFHTVCSGDSIWWNDTFIKEPGSYSTTYFNQWGCDSIETMVLTVEPQKQTYLQNTICPGEEYYFNDQLLYASGIYTQVLETPTCDSIVILQLTVLDEIADVELMVEICEGQEYYYRGKSYSTPGTYFIPESSEDGCLYYTKLFLSFRPNPIEIQNITICHGDAYFFNGQWIDLPGTYAQTIETTNCDSTLVLHLSVLDQVDDKVITAEICEGQVYIFNDQKLTEEGTYLFQESDEDGCQFTSTLFLVVRPIPADTNFVSICHGDAYFFNGQWIDLPGTYAQTIETTNCDSILVLHLSVVDQVDDKVITAEICEGQVYYYKDHSYTNPGTFFIDEMDENGCLSTSILTVVQHPTEVIDKNISLCRGDGYLINNTWVYDSGEYIEEHQNTRGCDSIIHYNISFYEDLNASISSSSPLCDEGSILLRIEGPVEKIEWEDGSTERTVEVASPGIYFATVYNTNNCQKTLNIEIEQETPPEISLTKLIQPNACTGTFGSVHFPAQNWIYSIDDGLSWHTDSIIIEKASVVSLSVASMDTTCIWRNIKEIEIEEIPIIGFNDLEVKNNSNCSEPNGLIRINALYEDNQQILFSIDNGRTFSSDPEFTGLSSGTYYPVIKREENFCIIYLPDSVQIHDPPAMEYHLVILDTISCQGNNSGAIFLHTNQPLDIRWSTGETTPIIEDLNSGTYSVTIEDSYQCISVEEVLLKEGPVIDTWTFPPDTIICTGDTIWLELPPFDVTPVIDGNADFLEKERLLGFYNKGVYEVSFYINDKCFSGDDWIIEEETRDFSGVDFLLGEEGLVNSPITVIDITWPLTDLSEWSLQDTNITIVDQIENQLILSFAEAGLYEIGLTSHLGNCSTSITKTIEIYDDPAFLQNQEKHLPSGQQIIDFSLFPNPNNGSFKSKIILNQNSDIFLIVVDHMGNRITEITGNGENNYIVDFNLENHPPGIYALILLSENQERYILFNKI